MTLYLLCDILNHKMPINCPSTTNNMDKTVWVTFAPSLQDKYESTSFLLPPETPRHYVASSFNLALLMHELVLFNVIWKQHRVAMIDYFKELTSPCCRCFPFRRKCISSNPNERLNLKKNCKVLTWQWQHPYQTPASLHQRLLSFLCLCCSFTTIPLTLRCPVDSLSPL